MAAMIYHIYPMPKHHMETHIERDIRHQRTFNRIIETYILVTLAGALIWAYLAP